MIIRQWRGRADQAHEDAYPAHFRAHVAGELRAVRGFLGADLMRRTDTDGAVEFTVLTRWASMDAIHAFAGDDPTRAVVEPGAQAALTDYDLTVTHHTVVDHVPSGLEDPRHEATP
jgi:heme-degrading monooxygenase HmoA